MYSFKTQKQALTDIEMSNQDHSINSHSPPSENSNVTNVNNNTNNNNNINNNNNSSTSNYSTQSRNFTSNSFKMNLEESSVEVRHSIKRLHSLLI